MPEIERIPPQLRQLLEALLDGQQRWPLYLYGPAGVGKTYAVYWAINQVPSSLYVRFDAVADVAWEREASLWYYLWKLSLVAVDEIGLRTSDRDFLALKRAADLREGRPAIWVSNLSPKELERVYDERIVSRLCCGTVLQVVGPDQRM